MVGEKVEFYGENLTILAISRKIGISRETLNKYYKQTGNIYQAEAICRRILAEKEASLVEYNGERLAIETIAKREEVDPKTLKKYYEQMGDIQEAIAKCKEGKIDYDGQKMTLDGIARKEGIKRDTLERQYNKTGDIYQAVQYCKDLKKQKEEALVEYHGEKRTITSVAKEVNISKATLKKYYQQTGNIYLAIQAYRDAQQEVEDAKVEYKGKKTTVKAIARDEDVAETTLTRYMHRYENIDKAVFMAKMQRQRTRRIRMKNKNINLYDLSVILGIKYMTLVNMLNKGMTIEQIKEQQAPAMPRNKLKQEVLTLENGQSLLEYCVENGLNYSYIYRAINTYGKTLAEAVKSYQENGSKLPNHWIFEKFGLLLRHLMTENKMNIQSVVRYMRAENLSMSEAMEKYVIRRNAKKEELDPDWMQEIYGVLTDENMAEEYDEFKKTFWVTEQEEECVIRSYDEAKSFERKLLLFEIGEVIRDNAFSQEEMPELLQAYEVKPSEIETIFFELYGNYEDGVLLGQNEPEMKRRRDMNGVAKQWYYLSQEERNRARDQYHFSQAEVNHIVETSANLVKYTGFLTVTREDARGKGSE